MRERTGMRTGMLAMVAVITITACGDDSSGGGAGDAGGATTLALAAENLFDSDFEKVCDGVGQTAAAPYTPAPGAIHPVIVLVEQEGFMSARSSAVRAGWERMWAPEAPMALAELELVACAARSEATRVEECTGYEVDGQVTDHIVHLNETTYEITLRAAATGAEVDRTVITALDDACPMFVSFDAGETEIDWYSFDDEAVQEFLAPHVQPGA